MKKVLLGFLLLMSSCAGRQIKEMPPQKTTSSISVRNAIYYWKSVFNLTEAERNFLVKHEIDRIYLKMFDVVTESNYKTGEIEVVPVATTRFDGGIPDSVEIVPTVFITLEALQSMTGHEHEFSKLIVERLLAMAEHNNCGTICEVQFDCDWTVSTRASYAALCRAAKEELQSQNIALSATIRLHQLTEAAPPVDRGVLMLYNTGSLKNIETHNSILDIKDCKPYFNAVTRDSIQYGIPLDYAYPVFGWSTWFRDGNFQAILRTTDFEVQGLYEYPSRNVFEVTHSHVIVDGEQMKSGDIIRKERPAINDILAVKKLAEQVLGTPARYNIIYHLDNQQLSNYSDHEIAQIYAGN